MAAKTKPRHAANRTACISEDDALLMVGMLRYKLLWFENEPCLATDPISHANYLASAAAYDRVSEALDLPQRWEVKFPSVLSAGPRREGVTERGREGEGDA